MLTKLYKILDKVLNDKVFYGTNVYDNSDNASMPFIVYQEISKRPVCFFDNQLGYFRKNVQITLVTTSKDILLEEKLEKELLKNNYPFTMISEYRNHDKSLNRVYEIYMEEI